MANTSNFGLIVDLFGQKFQLKKKIFSDTAYDFSILVNYQETGYLRPYQKERTEREKAEEAKVEQERAAKEAEEKAAKLAAEEKAAKLAAEEKARIENETLVDKDTLLNRTVYDIKWTDNNRSCPEALKKYKELIESIKTGKLRDKTLTASSLKVAVHRKLTREWQYSVYYDFHRNLFTGETGNTRSFYYVE